MGFGGLIGLGCEASSKTRITDTVRTPYRTWHERPKSAFRSNVYTNAARTKTVNLLYSEFPFRYPFHAVFMTQKVVPPNETHHRVSCVKMQCLQSPPLWWDLCNVQQWQSYQSYAMHFYLPGSPAATWLTMCWVDLGGEVLRPLVHSRTVLWCGPFPNRCREVVHFRTV